MIDLRLTAKSELFEREGEFRLTCVLVSSGGEKQKSINIDLVVFDSADSEIRTYEEIIHGQYARTYPIEIHQCTDRPRGPIELIQRINVSEMKNNQRVIALLREFIKAKNLSVILIE